MFSFDAEEVIQRLRDIAAEQGVKIVCAVNYDWDTIGLGTERSMPGIQFFYVRQTPWYLGLDERCAPIDASSPSSYHMMGYELKTALGMITEGDVSMIEVFCGDPVAEWKLEWTSRVCDFVTTHFDLRSACKKYQDLAASYTFEKIGMKAERIESVMLRLRYILCQKWLIEKKTFPPIDIADMVDVLITDLDDLTMLRRIFELKDTDVDAYKRVNTQEISSLCRRLNLSLMPLVMKLPRSKGIDYSELSNICRETIQDIWLVKPEDGKNKKSRSKDKTEPADLLIRTATSSNDEDTPVVPRSFFGGRIKKMANRVSEAVNNFYDGLDDSE